jgi:hypothetical protein
MAEQKTNDLLGSLKIAAPCSANWDLMEGNNRVRHCSDCNKNVYNISDMATEAANEFLHLTASQACVRFYKRMDGTIIT